ncbi:helix-turn-helix transcriptional regulator [Atopobium sp. oral taxon 416]|jgi:putative transcriptional regulator|uniref:helix-turn-helix transcriptional regulator n=1 Tax=Atopobium sp. oral taxon 416 TaxID=712157 RepID=UPI003530387E
MPMRNIIKRLRKDAGLRQEDMAKELGVSRQTIIAIENDKYNPSLELAMKIAKLLNLHVDEIFFLDE